MKTIAASKFKEKCLSILNHPPKEGLIILKHGKPVAKLFPINRTDGLWIGSMKSKIQVNGNIFSTGVKWDAES